MNNSQQVYHVLILEDGDLKKKIILKEATYSIGRHSSNDIILLSPKTSRNHATLLRRTDVKNNSFSYWILDGDLQGNRSRNGIFVNGKKCLVYELKHGDVINFGNEEQAKYQILTEQSTVFDEVKGDSPQIQKNRSSIDKKTVINKETLINFSESPANNNQNSLELVRLASFAELNPHPIIEIDFQGNITYLNSSAIIALKNIQQKRNSHPLLTDLITHFSQENSKILVREIQVDERIFLQNAHYLPENEIIRTYLTDITEKKQLANSLNEQKNIYQALFKQVNEGIIFIEEASKKIIEVNNHICQLLGYSIEELLKLNIKELQEDARLIGDLEQNFSEKNSLIGEYNLRHRDGSVVTAKVKVNLLKTSQGNKYILTINALTEEITSNLQEQITGLPDQAMFKKQLAMAIANAKRNQKLVAVISLNLQRFTEINQTLGEELGNVLLANFAERLKTCLRMGDTVSYWGEDQFGILMPQISGVEEAAKISQRIIESLEKSFKIRNYKFSIKCNIGIAIYPQDGEQVNILLKNANQALSRTQEQGSYKYQFYSYSMNSQASVQLRLEALLHHALERDEFILYYQPQINVNSGNIQGVEALLRWQHPELGLVSPASFIKLAEQTGLIIPIGEWVLKTACTQNKVWQSSGIPPLRVSVNLSALQFQQPNLPGTVAKILHETDLEPNLLELEIAAVTLMQNIEYSQQILQQLNTLGVHISIDDFASGFSSLEHLKKFPFHTLKIDQSFVHDLKNDPKDLAIISALVSLGRGFNLRVVAEGVETQQQIDLLRSLECEQMQGFWFSRPLAAEDASKWLPID
ncbi:EAL domain-containing protein [Stanieria cyanosphaera]|nr:EAL domain-containing protein [Stanieria cyanosphaera]